MDKRSHIKLSEGHREVLIKIESEAEPDDYDEDIVNDLLFDGYIDEDCGIYFLTPKAMAIRGTKRKTF